MAASALTRIFSGDKMIAHKPLNALGVQVARTVGARLLYQVRSGPGAEAYRDELEELREEGMVLIPNFLPRPFFESVRDEAGRALDSGSDQILVKHHGPNKYEVAPIHQFDAAEYPHLHEYVQVDRLKAVMSAAEKQPFDDVPVAHQAVERLTQGPYGEDEDPETDLHSDIFFNTHKSWLYLDDVTLDHGPLVYVPRSHHLSLKQLQYVYRHSQAYAAGKDVSESRRITQAELDDLGLKERIVTCPANTLVIANTCGYHRRLRGKPGMVRRSFHVSLRGRPFLWWKNG